jgi:hypothetical protein
VNGQKPTTTGDADDRRRLLRCEKCGASLVGFLPDLLRYTREGWPKCCGRVMAVFAEETPEALQCEAPVPKGAPVAVPDEARELLDRAKDGAEQVAADIKKSKELLESPGAQADGAKPAGKN